MNSQSNPTQEEHCWKKLYNAQLQVTVQSHRQYRTRNEDHRNRTEDPEINLCEYGHLILDKGVKNTFQQKAQSANGVGKAGYLPIEE